MKNKKKIAAKIFRKRVKAFDLINHSCDFYQEKNVFFHGKPEFGSRFQLHEFIGKEKSSTPITYLEFGVWQGATFRKWLELNTHQKSRFVGFDSFEGLPEFWNADAPKGHFSTQGKMPEIEDKRGQFIKGWFQNTLYGFLDSSEVSGDLVVHIDCDLYSSTLFVLGALDRFFRPGTVLIFDDFTSVDHEFAAWMDYRRSFGRTWAPIATTEECKQAAVQLVAN